MADRGLFPLYFKAFEIDYLQMLSIIVEMKLNIP